MIISHVNFAKGFRGGESQTLQLIKSLSKRGIYQQLIIRENPYFLQKAKDIKNLEIVVLKKPYILFMSKIKKSHLLHAHETKAAQFAYFYYLRYKVPYVITRRVDIIIKNNFLNKNIYKMASTIVALSNAIKKKILKLDKDLVIDIVPDSINEHKINKQNIEKLKNRFSKKFVIGNIAALEKEKGQEIIFEVAKKLEKTNPNIHFIFLGNGRDEQFYRSITKNLSNVTFEGFVLNVGDYLSIFDIFVFPSKLEGFGSSILDAMSFNVPVIASNIGGIPDIIKNNKNGILINLSSDELFDKIELLYNDKKFYKEVIKNSNSCLEKYSVDTICEEYLSLYKNL